MATHHSGPIVRSKDFHAAAQQSCHPRRRDLGASLHQSVRLSRHRAAHRRARPGRLCLRHRRQALHRRHGGAVVHRARLRQRGAGRGRGGADAQALLRPSVHRQEPRPGHRACGETERDRAGADLKGVLLQFRIGGQRHPGQAGLVSQQRARPAEQKENHQPREGLSRRHHRGGVADRAAGEPPRLRPAAAGLFARQLARIIIVSRKMARARSNSPPALPKSSKR